MISILRDYILHSTCILLQDLRNRIRDAFFYHAKERMEYGSDELLSGRVVKER